MLCLVSVLVPRTGLGLVFVVDSTGDTPDADPGDRVCDDGTQRCTLRAAIVESNLYIGSDLITFNLPGSGVQTIRLVDSLPDMNEHGGTVIDGSTQPGFAGTPLVEIDGSAVTFGHCLRSAGGHASILSINVHSCGSHGIILSGSHLNQISGCYIGTDPTGTLARGNGVYGIFVVGSSDNFIGGTTPAEANVISANGSDGVNIAIDPASGTSILGNLIGTDATGTRALGNGGSGISVGAGSGQVGDARPGAGNVISGNGLYGVRLRGVDATSNVVAGNLIGTDITGMIGLPNLGGVAVDDAPGNTIGVAGWGNVIAGNLATGVRIDGTESTGVQLRSNLVGVARDGITPLPNGGEGVVFRQGASRNTLGGSSPTEGNVIAYNGGTGVLAEGGERNTIRANSIFANGGLGIDLGSDGSVTPNDAGDGDVGANDLQNFPVLTSALAGCVETTVAGTIGTIPGASFTIELFGETVCDASGHGEGRTFLGVTTVTTDGAGTGSFQTVLPAVIPGSLITATATDSNGNTSEFSACVEVSPSCASCLVANLRRITLLKGVKSGVCSAEFSWSSDPAAGFYHLNSVASKEQLTDPRRFPGNGVAECDTTAPTVRCADQADCSRAVVFYQALSACGSSGDEEGPF